MAKCGREEPLESSPTLILLIKELHIDNIQGKSSYINLEKLL